MNNNPVMMVKEFFETYDQEILNEPSVPSLAVRKLRAKLILEEALETIKGLGFALQDGNTGEELDGPFLVSRLEEFHEPSLVEIADGLADLHYVGYCGTALACGIGSKIDQIFAEVHRSNMSKLWTEKDLEKIPLGMKFRIVKITDEKTGEIKRLIKDQNNKVIKSPSYSPANIEQFLK